MSTKKKGKLVESHFEKRAGFSLVFHLRRIEAGRYYYRGKTIVRRDPLTHKTNPTTGARECVTWRDDHTYKILGYTLREAMKAVDRRFA